MRIAAYAFSAIATLIAAILTRSLTMAVLTGLAAAVVAFSLAFRHSWGGRLGVLLVVDALGSLTLWWLFGSIAVVDFILFYVVAAAALLLPRPKAIRLTGLLVVLTLGQFALHAPRIAPTLPLYHTHGEFGFNWLGEVSLRSILVLGATVLFFTIADLLRRSEQAVEDSQDRYRKLVDASPDTILVHSGSEVLFANPAAADLVGALTPEDLIGLPLERFIHPDSMEPARSRIAAVLDGNPCGHAELKFIRLDGATIDVESVGIPITFDGQPASQAILRDITQRKLTERALQESEARYRSFFEGIPTPLYRTTPDGRIADANDALVDLLGYPDRESLLDLYVYDAFVRPSDRTESQLLLHEKGEMIGFEQELYRHDGQTIWVRDTSRSVRDIDGSVLFYEGAMVDVTQRKQAEAALRESEERFRSAFQNAPVGMALVTLDGTMIRVNRMLCQMLGRAEGDLLGRTTASITPPDDQAGHDAMYQRLIADELPFYRMETRLLHSGGRSVWTNFSATLVRDTDGDPIYGIVQVEDITERKRAEETTGRLTRILEETPDFVAIADPDGRFTYANRAARGFAEIAADADVTSVNVRDVIALADGPLDATLEEILHGDVWHGILTLTRPDGTEVPASTVIINHRSSNGKIRYMSAIARDISDRIRTERHLEKLVRSKDDFVASVSHELRTPLTAVVGLTQELRDGWSRFSSAETLEFVSLIADQSTEVANIVEDLLVAARADIGKVTISARDIDICEQVDAVVAALGLDPEENIHIEQAPEARAWADAARVRQIIRNLLTNALRYGGRHLELRVQGKNGSVFVTVSDDGPGVPEEQRESIFEPYERAHTISSQPASVGLGLTVSRQLARLMGGDLVYQPTETGSTFELALPASPPEKD